MIAVADRPHPTRRELRLFALLLLAFVAALGLVIWRRPEGLRVAAAVLAAAWLGSLLLNRDLPARVQARGVLLPALFLGAQLPLLAGASSGAVALGWSALGGALAVAALARAALARRIYDVWMDAALPVGWSISRVLLGLVWYGLVSPIGVIQRLAGRDPLARRFEPAAPTYWTERRPPERADRYFRQY